jgi:D-alanyl-D-alanine carboxypeptidase (penicillin-binding protein 5/6)
MVMQFLASHRRLSILGGVFIILALFVLTAAVQYSRPIPELSAIDVPSVDSGSDDASVQVPWPSNGSSALGVAGINVIGASPDQQPRPIASLVKVMTAYLILKDHPLTRGQPGPEIEITPAHVAGYQARNANGESVVAVKAGTNLTERDLLRGLLLASANNFADILAEWDAGSVEAFIEKMNAEAQALGMKDTRYADAAGLDPSSSSSARDQLTLANVAMTNETFAATVAEVQATLPLAGIVYNTNALLGQDGIVGLKTGWTEEAGACFMFAVRWQVEDRPVLILGVVLGQDTLADAFRSTRSLIPVVEQNLSLVRIGNQGDAVARVVSAWGDSSAAVLSDDAVLVLMPGVQVQTSIELADGTTVKDGGELGSLRLSAGDQQVDVPLKASGSVGSPGLLWRLTRQ